MIGCVLAIGTASIAGSYSNLMDYIQSLFSFFNAPLFAIFILGLFWKRMTGTAGWTGLISGTIAAVIVDVLVRTERHHPVQPGGQLRRRERGVRRRRDRGGHRVDGHAAEARRGAVRADLGDLDGGARPGAVAGEDTGWYRSPVVLGAIVLILTIVLYIICGERDVRPHRRAVQASALGHPVRPAHGDRGAVRVYGIVLTIMGIIGETPENIAKSGGLNLNLWTGLFMLVVGIIFYVWAFMKPPMPPEQDHVDHYQEGGPLHMGHDFAELHPDEVERRKRRHGHGH